MGILPSYRIGQEELADSAYPTQPCALRQSHPSTMVIAYVQLLSETICRQILYNSTEDLDLFSPAWYPTYGILYVMNCGI